MNTFGWWMGLPFLFCPPTPLPPPKKNPLGRYFVYPSTSLNDQMMSNSNHVFLSFFLGLLLQQQFQFSFIFHCPHENNNNNWNWNSIIIYSYLLTRMLRVSVVAIVVVVVVVDQHEWLAATLSPRHTSPSFPSCFVVL